MCIPHKRYISTALFVRRQISRIIGKRLRAVARRGTFSKTFTNFCGHTPFVSSIFMAKRLYGVCKISFVGIHSIIVNIRDYTILYPSMRITLDNMRSLTSMNRHTIQMHTIFI